MANTGLLKLQQTPLPWVSHGRIGKWSCLSWWSNFLRTKAEDNISAISWGRKYKLWATGSLGFRCGCATDSWKNLAVQVVHNMLWSSWHGSFAGSPWPLNPSASWHHKLDGNHQRSALGPRPPQGPKDPKKPDGSPQKPAIHRQIYEKTCQSLKFWTAGEIFLCRFGIQGRGVFKSQRNQLAIHEEHQSTIVVLFG